MKKYISVILLLVILVSGCSILRSHESQCQFDNEKLKQLTAELAKKNLSILRLNKALLLPEEKLRKTLTYPNHSNLLEKYEEERIQILEEIIRVEENLTRC